MKTVLFWDDDHALRTVLSEVLRNEGFRVLEVADMAEAVQLCEAQQGPVDLSIVKASYGMSAIHRLSDLYPDMRTLFIGDPEWETRVLRLAELRPDWLPTPFSAQELTGVVRKLIRAGGRHACK